MRTRKKYPNGKPRGGTPGRPTETERQNPKDYHRTEIGFHGNETSYQKWAAVRRGY